MDSVIKTFKYDNGEIQRVQQVTLEKEEAFHFFKPAKSEKAFERICALYKNFTVPKCPYIFGRMMHFCLPEDIRVPEEVLETAKKYENKYGILSDDINKVAIAFKETLKISNKGEVSEKRGKRSGHSEAVSDFYRLLKDRGCAKTVCGKLPLNKILPVGRDFGLISESEKGSTLKANSTFFIMDSFDVTSLYDVIGTPFGLTAENGTILTPPLYKREAFTVGADGSVRIESPEIKDLTVRIGGLSLKDGEEGVTFFERPKRNRTPLVRKKERALDLAVIGKKVVAVKKNGKMTVPAAGFVIRIKGDRLFSKDNAEYDKTVRSLVGAEVTYAWETDVRFAVSAGNSLVINGEKTTGFKAKYYNIRFPWKVKYPPSLYPLSFKRDRAPRMAIGEDSDAKLVLLWFEGKGKFSYEKGVDSCGASLKEMADICSELGIRNAVNLDGGGSAQIMYKGKRELKISDRNKKDNTESERAIPLGLCVK